MILLITNNEQILVELDKISDIVPNAFVLDSAEVAVSFMSRNRPKVVIADLDIDNSYLFSMAQKQGALIGVLCDVTNTDKMRYAIEASIFDFIIPKPLSTGTLLNKIINAIQKTNA